MSFFKVKSREILMEEYRSALQFALKNYPNIKEELHFLDSVVKEIKQPTITLKVYIKQLQDLTKGKKHQISFQKTMQKLKKMDSFAASNINKFIS